MEQVPVQGSWLAAGGSSTSSKASDQFDVSSRLVIGAEALVRVKL
jgi:hypothetical protein